MFPLQPGYIPFPLLEWAEEVLAGNQAWNQGTRSNRTKWAKTLGNRVVDRRVVFGPESWAFAADNGAEKSR